MVSYTSDIMYIPDKLIKDETWYVTGMKFKCTVIFNITSVLNCCALNSLTVVGGYVRNAHGAGMYSSDTTGTLLSFTDAERKKKVNYFLLTKTFEYMISMIKKYSGSYPLLMADSIKSPRCDLWGGARLGIKEFIDWLITTEYATVSCLPAITNVSHGPGRVKVWQVEFKSAGVSLLHDLKDSGGYLKIADK